MRQIAIISFFHTQSLLRFGLFKVYLVFSLLTALLATTVGGWSIAESFKIQDDIWAFFLHIGGGFFTIFIALELFQKNKFKLETSSGVGQGELIIAQVLAFVLWSLLTSLLLLTLYISLYYMQDKQVAFSQIVLYFLNYWSYCLYIAGLCYLVSSFELEKVRHLLTVFLWICGLILPKVGELQLAAEGDPGAYLGQFTRIFLNFQIFNRPLYEFATIDGFWVSFTYGLAAGIFCFFVGHFKQHLTS